MMAVSATTARSSAGARTGLITLLTNQRTALFLLTVLLFVGFGIANPMFFNAKFVVFPLLRDTAMYAVVGLAQMCALSIGHLNLAVGRQAAVSAMAAGFAYERMHLSLLPGALLGLIVGALIGALTGWIIVRSGAHSFVVTLAMDFVLLGLVTLIYSSTTDAAAFTTKPAGMDGLRNGSFADICVGTVCGSPMIPLLALPSLVAILAVGYIYGRSSTGREFLATGSNLRAAELSGIPTGRRVIQIHMMSGLLAGFAGLLLAVTSGSFSASIGNEFMIPSFIGPVLGGTLLAGGFVSVLGTVLGVALTGVIRQGLTVQGVSVDMLNIALGVVLLLALSAQRLQVIRVRRRGRLDVSAEPGDPPPPAGAPPQFMTDGPVSASALPASVVAPSGAQPASSAPGTEETV